MKKRTQLRVLVVERRPSVRKFLVKSLTEAGYVPEAVPTAAAALKACAKAPFSLAIIGLWPPGMSAFDLATTLNERWPNTTILVTAPTEERPTALACLKAGAHDYVMKPFDLHDLLAHTRRALEQRPPEADAEAAGPEGRVDRESRAVRRVLVGAVKALSSALEAKDLYTRGHSERVSRLVGKITREIEMPPREARRLRLAARLHDVGKIGVPESVLSKPGPLSDEEYRQIQAHPVIGERILGPVVADSEVLSIVRHHHEHWSGAGYPDRLAEDDIPLGARILAVADAFDALTSDRPYRRRLDTQAALEVLRAGAGEQWERPLVEAVIRVVERFPNNHWDKNGR